MASCTPRRAQRVAGHRFGRRDSRAVIAEHFADRAQLFHVADRRGGAVRVQVADRGIHARASPSAYSALRLHPMELPCLRQWRLPGSRRFRHRWRRRAPEHVPALPPRDYTAAAGDNEKPSRLAS